MGQAAENVDVLRALFAAGSHADFAEDHQRPERAFGMVVGGRTTEADEGEYFGVLARAGDEAFPQGVGFVIAE